MANQAAFQSGWESASRLLAERRARKQALSDEEFKLHAERVVSELDGNRKILGGIDREREPDKYKSKVADLQQNLADLRTLFHPDVHPGALARFGHMLLDAVHLTNPQARIHKVETKQRAAIAGDRRDAEELAASVPPAANPDKQYLDALTGAGLSRVDAAKALKIKLGLEARAVAERPEHQSDFEKGLQRFVVERGGDPGDISASDELAYRKSLHRAAPAKPPHESDYEVGFRRYLRERGIPWEKATSKDEARYRLILHPPRPLKDLKSEAAKRKPAKRSHSKPYPPFDPSHDGPHSPGPAR